MDETPEEYAKSFVERSLAQGTPEENYQALLEGLRVAAQGWRAGDKLDAGAFALGVVVRFLQAHPALFREGLTVPLEALQEAATMLANGQNPQLFQVPRSTKLKFGQDGIKAATMAAYDRLVAAGVSLEEGSHILGKELRRLGFSLQDKTIFGWRNTWLKTASHEAKARLEVLRTHVPMLREPPQDRARAEREAKELLKRAASGASRF